MQLNTPEWLDKYKELVASGLSQRQACAILGIARATVYDTLIRVEQYNHVEKNGSKTVEDNSVVLIISDMHIPYHHPKMLDWLQSLKDKYKPTRIISMGDECFPPDVEILTENGFVRFDEISETTRVAQWEEDSTISFVKPSRIIKKPYDGHILKYSHKSFVSKTTPKHNLVKVDNQGIVHRREAWDTYGNEAWAIPRYGYHCGEGCGLDDDEIRLYVAFQADGTFTKGAVRLSFKKERKIQRIQSILNNLNIPFNLHNVKRGDFQLYIEKGNVPDYLTKVFNIPVPVFSLEEKNIFLKELGEWDGTSRKGHTRYTSALKENVEYVQMMAVTSGCYASPVKPANGECSAYSTDVVWEKEKCSIRTAKKELLSFNGFVYCCTVDTGMIIVRQDGHISVSGNCDKHALSYHDSDPNLKSAGDELSESLIVIKKLHEMFPVMDILESNHGSLIYRKAKTHGIPKQYLKSYNDVLGVDSGWKWHFDLTITLPNGSPIYFHHGKSSDGLRLSQTMGMSCVQGHFHEKFKIDYWANPLGLYWAMQVGCLIDDDSLAFAYNNVNLKRPIIGCGVIVDGVPILEAMPL